MSNVESSPLTAPWIPEMPWIPERNAPPTRQRVVPLGTDRRRAGATATRWAVDPAAAGRRTPGVRVAPSVALLLAACVACTPAPEGPVAEPVGSVHLDATTPTPTPTPPPTSTTAAPPPGPTSAPATASPRGSSSAALADGLAGLLDRSGADGGIAVYQRGRGTPVVVTAGTIDDSGAPMPTGRPFPIASVTKSFTAALLVDLAADGSLDLDAPISDWLDWRGGDRITVRHLLTHTSGLGPWAPATGDGVFDAALFADLGANRPLAEVVDLAREVAPVGPPGAQTSYSNLNYVLAGRIAELAGGAPFARLLAERITGPLGLSSTTYPAGSEASSGAEPLPGTFEYPAGTIVSTADVPRAGFLSLMGPAAAAMSTVDDLLAWAQVLFRERLLAGVDLAPLTDIGEGGYGLGVLGVDRGLGSCVFTSCLAGTDFEYLGLNGEAPGSAVRLWYDPATDAVLLVYLNRDGTSLDAPLVALMERLAAVA